jgi:predicted MFS family arabinose efflux permease
MAHALTRSRFSALIERERAASGAPLWVALGLAVGPLVAIGLARFAYALLLPSMRADLAWSYSQAGAMNTANAAGYLAGAILTARLATRHGERTVYLVGLFGTALSLIGCGAGDGFAPLLALRAAAGFFGALAFVAGAALAAAAGASASAERQGMMVSIYFAGAGAGVVFSSVIVPLALTDGGSGWRWGWLGFGAVSLLAGLVSLPAVRHRPARAPVRLASRAATARVSLAAAAIAYTLCGAGYIAYMTFVIAFLGAEHFAPATVSTFWTVLGLASVAAGFGWGYVLSRLPGGWPLAVVLAVLGIGALLPLVNDSGAIAFLSAVLFGGAQMAAPAAVTVLVRMARPPATWTREIGWLTVLFGIGQCIGPLLAGALSDTPSGVRLGLLVSVAILALAAVIAALQRDAEQRVMQ